MFRRISLSFVLTTALIFGVVIPQTACSPSQLEASAADVLSVVTNQELINALQVLSPGAVAELAKLVPAAKALIDAIHNGNGSSAGQLIATIFPVIEQIAALFININPAMMAILAIANIALHFLLNHLPKSKSLTVSGTYRKLVAYKTQAAWGCQYHAQDKRCTQ